ncbi:Wadjet anti-phage system protein JetD domain-containing protein [Azohydromonas lata]|uniref:DUF2220 family protein n=1 Tax=Azohydromonas lata TaxID=45677 RepID=A0ABU5I8L0_9BURK|nr:Wadjet anti-phage system protein JetD domain-containing protein [Azohydromonas lata]MDZ5455303.1 DUF2220 family protein [Azohydromonas lata]
MSAFLTQLAAWPRRRIVLEELKRLFYTSHPEFQNSPDRGAQLLLALRELQAQGRIALPAAGSWERTGAPPLPRWVLLARDEAPAPAAEDYARVPWVPELGFWTELKPAQLPAARALNDFLLRRRASLVRVPVKERSLEIFGDEKRLDALRSGDHLFGGRLSLHTLGAFVVPPPLPYRPAAAPGRPVLVVENHDSFWSFGEWNQHARRYAAVVYGAGEAFRSSGAALGQVLREVRASGAEYLGDLDPKGLRIPMEFNRAALPAGPQVAPALPAYRWLLDHGRTRDKAQCADADVDVACRWLDPDLGQRLAALWRAGQWIPQEALGYEQLMAGFMTPPCSIPG